MNCPGNDICELREHKGYDTCSRAGRCQSLEDEMTQVERNQDNAGKALGIAFMLVLTLACVWVETL